MHSIRKCQQSPIYRRSGGLESGKFVGEGCQILSMSALVKYFGRDMTLQRHSLETLCRNALEKGLFDN